MPETSASPGQSLTVGPAPLGPTAPAERIEVLDILRGFALFGVLAVNMEFFVCPSYAELFKMTGPPGPLDQLGVWLVRFFAETKFYTLFSLLFGYGAAVQMARTQARQVPFVSLYARKQTILLAFGAFHVVLLWLGDILLIYALLGLVLALFFRNRSGKTLLIWAFCGLLLPPLLMVGICGSLELAQATPDGAAAVQAELARAADEEAASARQAMEIFAHGSVADILARRVIDLKDYAMMTAFLAPNVLAMFLLGFLAGRHQLLHDPARHPGAFRKLLIVGLTVGPVANLVHTVVVGSVDWGIPSWSWVWALLIIPVSAPSLAALYVAIMVRLLRRPRWQQRLVPLAAIGRTALSNYLLQSVICTTICCSYGLGLYGRIKPPVGIALTVFIYALQVWLSVWWLRRFRFGPAEWLWRWLTYRRRPPMRARPSLPPGGSGDTQAM